MVVTTGHLGATPLTRLLPLHQVRRMARLAVAPHQDQQEGIPQLVEVQRLLLGLLQASLLLPLQHGSSGKGRSNAWRCSDITMTPEGLSSSKPVSRNFIFCQPGLSTTIYHPYYTISFFYVDSLITPTLFLPLGLHRHLFYTETFRFVVVLD